MRNKVDALIALNGLWWDKAIIYGLIPSRRSARGRNFPYQNIADILSNKILNFISESDGRYDLKYMRAAQNELLERTIFGKKRQLLSKVERIEDEKAKVY